MELSDMRVVKTYFIQKGDAPKTWKSKPAIKKPPTSGWGIVVILPGRKKDIIFSPFTLEAHSVPKDCAEIAYAKDLIDLVDLDYAKVVECIGRNLRLYAKLGIRRNHGVATKILNLFRKKLPPEQL